MKRILSTIFCLIIFLCFSGFDLQQTNLIDNTKFSHAVVSDESGVTETFAVNFNNFSIQNTNAKEIVLKEFNSLVAKLLLEKEQEIANIQDEDLYNKLNGSVVGIAEISDNLVYIKITYKNISSWNYFSGENQIEIDKRLFTYDAYVCTEKLATRTNLEGKNEYIANYVQQRAFILLDSLGAWRGDGTNMSSYTYITQYRRYHSTADSIVKYDGKYYHQWLNDNQPDIQIWTTRAIVYPWYIVAVLCGAVVIAMTLLVAKSKQKNRTQQIS